MKKIVASVGLAALGVSGIQTASAQSMTPPDNSKPWSVSATVRGFYDDNFSTIPDSVNLNVPPFKGQKKETFGFEVQPSAALRWALDQTTLTLGLVYSLNYYDNKPLGSSDHFDHVFQLNAALQHSFSEVQQLSVRDSFVIGQEPDLLRAGDTFSTFQRVSGDNIRNYGAIVYNAQVTSRLGLELGYDNAYYEYADHSAGGLSALLDRDENRAHIDLQFQAQPETHAILGYQFHDTSYLSDQTLAVVAGNPVTSGDRDARTHYVYVGLDHKFQQELSGTIKVGGEYTEYYNNPYSNGDHLSPYAQASLRWNYLPDSYVEGGFSYDRNATDVVGFTGNSFARDVQSAAVYGTINHHITPMLVGNLTAQYQDSTFEGGSFDKQSERYFLLGLNLEYRFTPNLSGSVGYNYDKLDSDVGRTFDRNRVYVGLTATY